MTNPYTTTVAEIMLQEQSFEHDIPLGFTIGEKGKRVYFSLLRTPHKDHFLAVDFSGDVLRKVRGKEIVNLLRVK